MQCLQGALYSFRKAQSNLEMLTVRRRSVNNHKNIKDITNQIGNVLAQENLKELPIIKDAASARELIIQIDGGHISIKEKDKRSFEALSVIVYRPENICSVDQHHRQINNKNCAFSSLDDELTTMEIYTLNLTLMRFENKE